MRTQSSPPIEIAFLNICSFSAPPTFIRVTCAPLASLSSNARTSAYHSSAGFIINVTPSLLNLVLLSVNCTAEVTPVEIAQRI